ncbi:MAG: ketoacyl-ACP synthase III [Muribaculaceae bacterium]|nr:ketoacyl-ACP synthase III [Bacteroides sp.]MDE6679833.1 ketoacyl-ACP synthase III [Muribaculaceae bacterium]MDE7190602.1 ketoacyl-ACP synthase III [Muribaculaceae bacterium]
MYINSMGHYVPAERIDNAYFEKLNGLTPDWIVQRTGIQTRSRAGEGENADTMGLAAIDEALKTLPYDIKEVDLIVAASYSVYDTVATLAHVAQRHYGIEDTKAFYMSAACSSFINALEVIEGYFASGKASKALLVCSEHNSYYSNETDPKSGHLWGDGAVAFFISKERQSDSDMKILDVYTEGLGHIGKGPAGVKLRPKEDGITMPDGRDVFLHACKYMIHSLKRSQANTGLTSDDLKALICHQANKRIVAQVAHMLELPMDKFLNNIEELGNTGSASAPLVLSQNKDTFVKGDKVALMVFGGGYSCGCFIVEV